MSVAPSPAWARVARNFDCPRGRVSGLSPLRDRMHRFRRSLGVLPVLLACSPVAATLRLTASPAAPRNIPWVERETPQSAALGAVDRVALRFGLAQEAPWPGECARVWRLAGYTRPTADGARKALGELFVCVVPPFGDTLEVNVAETHTTQWSPKGDSLRRALADTLAQYGALRIINHGRP
jgi:hypothetical protein